MKNTNANNNNNINNTNARNFRGHVSDRLEGGRILARTRYYATYEEAYDAAARLYLRRLGHSARYSIRIADREGYIY